MIEKKNQKYLKNEDNLIILKIMNYNNKMLMLSKILEEIDNTKDAIIVTLPASVKWEDYVKELDAARNYTCTLNFKVHNFPKGIKEGDKCYLVHQGFIKGWMEIVGFSEKSFECKTTGKQWKGKFIERSGPFHYLTDKLPMTGFQGFRYFNIEEYKNKTTNR